MMHAMLILASLFGVQDKDKEENPLGEKMVNTKTSSFRKGPSSMADQIRAAKYGEKVNVLAVEKGVWCKCTLNPEGTAYIHKTALIVPDKFSVSAEGEQVAGSEKAQNYNAGKFNDPVEKNYAKEHNLGPAFDKLNAWAGHPEEKGKDGKVTVAFMPGLPSYRVNPKVLDMKLRDFRRAGGLGEFKK